jgi:hypothetical protein
VNWDFPQAGTPLGSVHSLHWFAGNYIPQIPAALIQVLSKAGDLVFDPFCGSGTTGTEALRLGRRAVVSDRLSPCILISRAKLTVMRNGLDRRRLGELASALTFEHECRSDRAGVRGEGSNPELCRWYSDGTLAQLRFLWTLVEAATDELRLPLEAVFGDVLFQCASTRGSSTSTGKLRRHHWGWIADNVRPLVPLDHNAIGLFRERLAALGSYPALEADAALVLQQDARRMALPDAYADLVVTSPPYIGMIDYAHANRLLYLWMNWPMGMERMHEIGARFRRNRLAAVGEYLADMDNACTEIARVLKPGACCAIVLGASRKFPDAVQQTLALFEKDMVRVWGPVARRPSRRRVSDRIAGEAIEYVCVFQRQ